MTTRYVPTNNQDVQRLLQAVNRSILDQTDQRLFTFGDTHLIITDDANIGWGFNRVNALDAALTLTLPTVNRKDIGKTVTIANVTSSANTVTLQPQSATINGATSIEFSQAYGLLTLLAADTDKWLSYQSSGSWASPRWNYLNITGENDTAPFCVYQFDQTADSATNRIVGGSSYDLTFGGTGAANYPTSHTACVDGLLGQGFNGFLRGYSSAIGAGSYGASNAMTIEYVASCYGDTSGGLMGGITSSLTSSGRANHGLYPRNNINYSGYAIQSYHTSPSPGTDTTYMQTMVDNIVHYYAVTFSGTTVKLYIDGELVDTQTSTNSFNILNQSLYHCVGGTALVGTTMYDTFEGNVYSMRYTAAVLSATEIANSYAQVRIR